MRHGVLLQSGFRTGQKVYLTSKRLCLARMPGVVTGQCPDHVRVRVTAPWSHNVIFSVWARPDELTKRLK